MSGGGYRGRGYGSHGPRFNNSGSGNRNDGPRSGSRHSGNYQRGNYNNQQTPVSHQQASGHGRRSGQQQDNWQQNRSPFGRWDQQHVPSGHNQLPTWSLNRPEPFQNTPGRYPYHNNNVSYQSRGNGRGGHFRGNSNTGGGSGKNNNTSNSNFRYTESRGNYHNNPPYYNAPYRENTFHQQEQNVVPEEPVPPLLGSEEERQQKITEAADELKRKLQTNRVAPQGEANWYEDFNIYSLSADDPPVEETENVIKPIPELKHGPPELDLTLSDLKDIGRVDVDNTINPTTAAETETSTIDQFAFDDDIEIGNIHKDNDGWDIPQFIDLANIDDSGGGGGGGSGSIVDEMATNEKTNSSDQYPESSYKESESLSATDIIQSTTESVELTNASDTQTIDKNIVFDDNLSDAISDKQSFDKTQVHDDKNKSIDNSSNPEFCTVQNLFETITLVSHNNPLDIELTKNTQLLDPKNLSPNETKTKELLQYSEKLSCHDTADENDDKLGNNSSTNVLESDRKHVLKNKMASSKRSSNHDPRRPPPSSNLSFSSSTQDILQPPPAFDPRRTSNIALSTIVPEFDPKMPPPTIINQNDGIKPCAPFNTHLGQIPPPIPPVVAAPINIPGFGPPGYSPIVPPYVAPVPPVPPVPLPSFSQVIPPVDFPLAPLAQPPMLPAALAEVASEGVALKKAETNGDPNLSVDDVLGEMQEAMEFAQQCMVMDEEDIALNFPTLPNLPPLTEPVPPVNKEKSSSKSKKSKKSKETYGPHPDPDNIILPATSVEKESILEEISLPIEKKIEKLQDQKMKVASDDKTKIPVKDKTKQQQAAVVAVPPATAAVDQEEVSSDDLGRRKVVFNLQAKFKKLNKTEEWTSEAVDAEEDVKLRRLKTHSSPAHASTAPPPTTTTTATTTTTTTITSTKSSGQTVNSSTSRDESTVETGKIASNDGNKSNNNDNDKSNSRKKEEPIQSKSKERESDRRDRRKYRSHQESYSDSRRRTRRSTQTKSASKSDVDNSEEVNQSKSHSHRNISSKKESPTLTESSWKNRVISRFLKMSKNDIQNMINNSSLRKFDIAMQHLVKEKKSSMSLEMRLNDDEKVKNSNNYDNEDFMSQLQAILDPAATVDITNLPTTFIHQLSEVLHLDPLPPDLDDSSDKSESFNQEPSTSDIDHPILNERNTVESDAPGVLTHQAAPKTTQKIDSKQQSKESTTKSSAETNTTCTRTRSTKRNESDVNIEQLTATSNPMPAENLNMNDLDDIFTAGIRSQSKSSTKAAILNADMPTLSPTIDTIKTEISSQEHDEIPTSELDKIFSAVIAKTKAKPSSTYSSSSLSESRGEREKSRSHHHHHHHHHHEYSAISGSWKRKGIDDPDNFRNLTKEEYEARYGEFSNFLNDDDSQVSSSKDRRVMVNGRESINYYQNHDTTFTTFNSPPAQAGANIAESGEESDGGANASGTSSSSSSSSSSDEESLDVSKVLKYIKEREKIAKKKTVNDEIRDEVNAELERKRREKSAKHKSHKSRSRKKERRKKDKRGKKRKLKKKRKRKTHYSDASENDEDERPLWLLKEDEIKKEPTDIIPKDPHDHNLKVPAQQKITVAATVTPITSAAPTTLNSRKTDSQNVNTGTSNLSKQSSTNNSSAAVSNTDLANSNPTTMHSSTLLTSPLRTCTTPCSSSSRSSQSPLPHTKTKAQLKQMPETLDKIKQEQMSPPIKQHVNSNSNNSVKNSVDVDKISSDLLSNKSPSKPETPATPNSVLKPTLPVTTSPSTSSSSLSPSTQTLACDLQKMLANKRQKKVSTEAESSSTQSIPKTVLSSTPSTTTTARTASPKIDSPSQSATGPRKLDIKQYQERALQRKLKEQERGKKIAENPSILTQDLLNLPKKKPAALESNSFNAAKSVKTEVSLANLTEKIKSVDEINMLDTESLKKIIETTKAPRKAGEHSANSGQRRLKRNYIPNPPEIKSVKVESSHEENKFMNIKSEGKKEMKLKEKLIKKKVHKPVITDVTVLSNKIMMPRGNPTKKVRTEVTSSESTGNTPIVEADKPIKKSNVPMCSKLTAKTSVALIRASPSDLKNMLLKSSTSLKDIVKKEAISESGNSRDPRLNRLIDSTKQIPRQKPGPLSKKLLNFNNINPKIVDRSKQFSHYFAASKQLKCDGFPDLIALDLLEINSRNIQQTIFTSAEENPSIKCPLNIPDKEVCQNNLSINQEIKGEIVSPTECIVESIAINPEAEEPTKELLNETKNKNNNKLELKSEKQKIEAEDEEEDVEEGEIIMTTDDTMSLLQHPDGCCDDSLIVNKSIEEVGEEAIEVLHENVDDNLIFSQTNDDLETFASTADDVNTSLSNSILISMPAKDIKSTSFDEISTDGLSTIPAVSSEFISDKEFVEEDVLPVINPLESLNKDANALILKAELIHKSDANEMIDGVDENNDAWTVTGSRSGAGDEQEPELDSTLLRVDELNSYESEEIETTPFSTKSVVLHDKVLVVDNVRNSFLDDPIAFTNTKSPTPDRMEFGILGDDADMVESIYNNQLGETSTIDNMDDVAPSEAFEDDPGVVADSLTLPELDNPCIAPEADDNFILRPSSSEHIEGTEIPDRQLIKEIEGTSPERLPSPILQVSTKFSEDDNDYEDNVPEIDEKGDEEVELKVEGLTNNQNAAANELENNDSLVCSAEAEVNALHDESVTRDNLHLESSRLPPNPEETDQMNGNNPNDEKIIDNEQNNQENDVDVKIETVERTETLEEILTGHDSNSREIFNKLRENNEKTLVDNIEEEFDADKSLEASNSTAKKSDDNSEISSSNSHTQDVDKDGEADKIVNTDKDPDVDNNEDVNNGDKNIDADNNQEKESSDKISKSKSMSPTTVQSSSHDHKKHKNRKNRHHRKKSKLTLEKVKEAMASNIVKPVLVTKDSVMMRMQEIDLAIQKLMDEKMKLYQMLQDDKWAPATPTTSTTLAASQSTPESTEEISPPAEAKKQKAKNQPSIETTPKQQISMRTPRVVVSRLAESKLTSPTTESPTPKPDSTSTKLESFISSPKTSKSEDKKHKLLDSTEHPAPKTVKKRKHKEDKEEKEQLKRKDGSPEAKKRLHSDEHHHKHKKTHSNKGDEPVRKPFKLSQLLRDFRPKTPIERKHRSPSPKETNRSRKSRSLSSEKRHVNKETPKSKHENVDNSDKESEPISEAKPKEKARKNLEKALDASASKSSKDLQSDATPSLIYSDDSTWDHLDRFSDKSERSTGLVLLEESMKREKAAKKSKLGVTKRKTANRRIESDDDDEEENNHNKNVVEEIDEDVPLLELAARMKMERKKHSAKKVESKPDVPPKPVDHMSEIIDAVAENRVDALYAEPKSTEKAKTIEIVAEKDKRVSNVREKSRERSRSKEVMEIENVENAENVETIENIENADIVKNVEDQSKTIEEEITTEIDDKAKKNHLTKIRETSAQPETPKSSAEDSLPDEAEWTTLDSVGFVDDKNDDLEQISDNTMMSFSEKEGETNETSLPAKEAEEIPVVKSSELPHDDEDNKMDDNVEDSEYPAENDIRRISPAMDWTSQVDSENTEDNEIDEKNDVDNIVDNEEEKSTAAEKISDDNLTAESAAMEDDTSKIDETAAGKDEEEINQKTSKEVEQEELEEVEDIDKAQEKNIEKVDEEKKDDEVDEKGREEDEVADDHDNADKIVTPEETESEKIDLNTKESKEQMSEAGKGEEEKIETDEEIEEEVKIIEEEKEKKEQMILEKIPEVEENNEKTEETVAENIQENNKELRRSRRRETERSRNIIKELEKYRYVPKEKISKSAAAEPQKSATESHESTEEAAENNKSAIEIQKSTAAEPQKSATEIHKSPEHQKSATEIHRSQEHQKSATEIHKLQEHQKSATEIHKSQEHKKSATEIKSTATERENPTPSEHEKSAIEPQKLTGHRKSSASESEKSAAEHPKSAPAKIVKRGKSTPTSEIEASTSKSKDPERPKSTVKELESKKLATKDDKSKLKSKLTEDESTADEDNENDQEPVRKKREKGVKNRSLQGSRRSSRSSRQSDDSTRTSRSRSRIGKSPNSRDASPPEVESTKKRPASGSSTGSVASRRRSAASNASAKEVKPSEAKPLRRKRRRGNIDDYDLEQLSKCKVRVVDCEQICDHPEQYFSFLQKYGIKKINGCLIAQEEIMEEGKSLEEDLVKEDITDEDKNHSDDDSMELIQVDEGDELAAMDTLEDRGEDGASQDMRNSPASSEFIASPNDDRRESDFEAIQEDDDEPNASDVEVLEKLSSPVNTTSVSQSDDNEASESRRTQYTVHKGPILDIKVFGDSFLAASEDGAIYRYSQRSNGILNIYKGHDAAVTCLYIHEIPGNAGGGITRWNLFSGSLDATLRCYDIMSGSLDRKIAEIGSPIQCMDQAWGSIFIGTKSGHISRYDIKSGCLRENKLDFSDKPVLALRASTEGARRVLIVASRNQPITIRDAQNGLFLRTISGQRNHTVYSLLRNEYLVYCGTSNTSIPVFDFITGEQVTQYTAGVGIVCMRLYKQLLFAGCYDGNIYVFDTKEPKLICSIPGPGNMLLSMEIVNNEIIAGSKDRRLHAWRMPRQIRTIIEERS